MAEKVREKIREFLPRAVVVGMTEMLFNPQGTTSYVRINCAFFQKAKVRMLEYEGVPEDFGSAGGNDSGGHGTETEQVHR